MVEDGDTSPWVGATELHAPNITSIAPNAFKDCTRLRIVDLPSIDEIDDYAFDGANSVTEVKFGPIRVLSHTFSDWSFYDDNDQYIDWQTDGMQSLVNKTFRGTYDHLTSYTQHPEGWPYKFEIVEGWPYYGKAAIVGWADDYTPPDGPYSMHFPPIPTYRGQPVIGIGEVPEGATSPWVNARSIWCEDPIVMIGSRAFKNCNELWTADLYSVKYIDYEAFAGVTSIKSVYMGPLEEVAHTAMDWTFYGTDGVTVLDWKDSGTGGLSKIRLKSFYGTYDDLVEQP